MLYVAKLNNTQDWDEHLFGQVSTCTGGYQLTIYVTERSHQLLRDVRLRGGLKVVYIDDVMSSQQY